MKLENSNTENTVPQNKNEGHVYATNLLNLSTLSNHEAQRRVEAIFNLNGKLTGKHPIAGETF